MLITLERVAGQESDGLSFEWDTLAPIPDYVGFAGSFAGVSNGALIVAGGANFPDGGAPWTGSVKVWTDKIFVLDNPRGQWKIAGKLPHSLGYGASVTTKDALVIIGGSDERAHYSDVIKLRYKNGKIEIDNLPRLPEAIANTAAVICGDVIYVAGGIKMPDSKIAERNFWSLDLSAKDKSWKVLPSWSGPGRMLHVAGVLNKSVYLFSGVELIDGNRKYLKDAYEYSSERGWKKIADLPYPLAAAPTPAYRSGESNLVVFGGDNGEQAAEASTLKERHAGFSTQILSYNLIMDKWTFEGQVFTDKKADAVLNPNGSIWAPVTAPLVIWNRSIVIPGGEVRPATRTPNVLIATPTKYH